MRHPTDAAAVLDQVAPEDTRRLLARLDGAAAFEVLSEMSPDVAARALDDMDDERARALLAPADFVRVASIIAHVDERRAQRLRALLPPGQRRNVEGALDYPTGSAGQLMDPRVATFREECTAREALERLREMPRLGLADLLVVSANGNLASTLSLATW